MASEQDIVNGLESGQIAWADLPTAVQQQLYKDYPPQLVNAWATMQPQQQGGPLNIQDLLKQLGGGAGSTGPKIFFTDVYGQKYTKAQYDQLIAQMQHLGGTFGYTVTPAMAQAALKQGVDPGEFAQRLQEVQAVNSTAELRQQFQSVLNAQGIKADVSSFAGGLKFVTGQSEPGFYKVWDEFAARAGALQAGFSVEGTGKQQTNQDLQLTRGQLTSWEKGLNLAPGSVSIDALGGYLQNAAKLAITALPESRYRNYGITKQDLLDVGAGKGTATQNMALQRIANEEQSFAQFRANPDWQRLNGGSQPQLGRQVGAQSAM